MMHKSFPGISGDRPQGGLILITVGDNPRKWRCVPPPAPEGADCDAEDADRVALSGLWREGGCNTTGYHPWLLEYCHVVA